MTAEKRRREHQLRKAPFFAIGVSLALLLGGIATGEPARILEQAVRVCLSCIGIG